MTLDWQNGLIIGALCALGTWWLMHRIRRTLEDRCPQCGCLGQKVIYYMEIGQFVGGIMHGRYYATYKFLRCRNNPSHVRCCVRDRYISGVALWLKKHFKPWQFRRTGFIDYLMKEAGICCPTKIIELAHLAKNVRMHIHDMPTVQFDHSRHFPKN